MIQLLWMKWFVHFEGNTTIAKQKNALELKLFSPWTLDSMSSPSDTELMNAFLEVSREYNEDLVSHIKHREFRTLECFWSDSREQNFWTWWSTNHQWHQQCGQMISYQLLWNLLRQKVNFLSTLVMMRLQTPPMIIIAITGVATLTVLIFIFATQKKTRQDICIERVATSRIQLNWSIPSNIHTGVNTPNTDTFENNSIIEYINTEADIGFELHDNYIWTMISSITDWNDYGTMSHPIYKSANVTDSQLKGFFASKVGHRRNTIWLSSKTLWKLCCGKVLIIV